VSYALFVTVPDDPEIFELLHQVFGQLAILVLESLPSNPVAESSAGVADVGNRHLGMAVCAVERSEIFYVGCEQVSCRVPLEPDLVEDREPLRLDLPSPPVHPLGVDPPPQSEAVGSNVVDSDVR